MKKILSTLLSVLMIVTCISFNTGVSVYANSATYTYEYTSGGSWVWDASSGEGTSATAGDTITIKNTAPITKTVTVIKTGKEESWNNSTGETVSANSTTSMTIPEGYRVNSITTNSTTVTIDIVSVTPSITTLDTIAINSKPTKYINNSGTYSVVKDDGTTATVSDVTVPNDAGYEIKELVISGDHSKAYALIQPKSGYSFAETFTISDTDCSSIWTNGSNQNIPISSTTVDNTKSNYLGTSSSVKAGDVVIEWTLSEYSGAMPVNKPTLYFYDINESGSPVWFEDQTNNVAIYYSTDERLTSEKIAILNDVAYTITTPSGNSVVTVNSDDKTVNGDSSYTSISISPSSIGRYEIKESLKDKTNSKWYVTGEGEDDTADLTYVLINLANMVDMNKSEVFFEHGIPQATATTIINITDMIQNATWSFNGPAASGPNTNVLGATGYVDVKLKSIGFDTAKASGSYGVAETSKVITYTFDVTPYDASGNAKTKLESEVTFRLPVTLSGYTYANVYHGSTFVGQKTIGTEGETKYIEVSAKEFSPYSYTLTNTKYVAPSGDGGGSGGGESGNTYKAPNTAVR